MAPFAFATLPSSHICHLRKPPNLMLPIRCSAAASSPSSVSTRSKAAHFDLKTYWTSLMVQINQKLDEAIPVQFPAQIYEAMRYSVLAKGAKRAPPVMCISAYELFGGSRLAAFPTACALEMMPC
ncbi:Isoprenoid synthase domain superfamily [Sesbania bispinosa]|nr:Isoprenoid synthase domain superfamily [Sesbania bispinosa]